MQIHKLASTDAFIVFDLDDAPGAGVVRSAPKILVDGATALARTLTYRFATFERRIGGASAGINAKPDERPAAVAGFVDEAGPLVDAGRYFVEAGRGVASDDLMALGARDGRPSAYWDRHDELTAVGVAVSADVATGGVFGRSVAIEGLDGAGVRLASQMVARGARVVAVATAEGTATRPEGIDVEALAAAWDAHGAACVSQLGAEVGAPTDVFAADSDVLVAGSKPGVIDDEVASGLRATVVVPSGAVPVTAKALAALRRAGVVVLPDFVTSAGPLFAGWPDQPDADPATVAAAAIADSLSEVLGHADGPLLAACYRAEAFLATWRTDLPFGRPIA